MSRSAQTFRQSDLAKALKAAAKAGIEVQCFEVDRDGKIVVIAGSPTDAAPALAPQQNEWDRVK